MLCVTLIVTCFVTYMHEKSLVYKGKPGPVTKAFHFRNTAERAFDGGLESLDRHARAWVKHICVCWEGPFALLRRVTREAGWSKIGRPV
jgi:hypothetical protein